ncbi:MAG TPA: MgtC/SapB family protein [Chitinophagaceae bacterium]|jgi:uncharacterized membrane protein (DUF4010 family)|nr:MgtC/SapB family protein [Chitinophagaceae bacterium]
MEHNTWLLIFLSLGLGLLVGLQRESADSKTAGIRTFPLITMLGTICGLLAKEFNGWILLAGLIAVTALLVIGFFQRPREQWEGGGITTEAAVLIMYATGAYLVFGELAIGVVVTGIVTLLLHFKTHLHGWVDKIGETDLRAIMQFVLISMVILPVLPDRTYDQYDSLNPRNIWLMVVLIVGISLTGYFLYKIVGQRAGVFLGGILGGLISSTATTISYSKLGKTATATRLAAFVIVTASGVSLARVMAEIGLVAPSHVQTFLFPLAFELAAMILLITVLFFQHRKEKSTMPVQQNPAQLKGAILFALLYALISFISALAKDKFGKEALYVVSVISGLTDLDAVTLSTAKMTEQKTIEASLGWRLIMVAALSNLVFKAGIAMVIGNRRLGRTVAILFGLLIGCGLAIIFLWPY